MPPVTSAREPIGGVAASAGQEPPARLDRRVDERGDLGTLVCDTHEFARRKRRTEPSALVPVPAAGK